MGVFASGSDVGFGTIIGSAVFNVLFVTNVPFGRAAELTWWPLFLLYILIHSLVVLAVFGVDYYGGAEGTVGENFIEWWSQ